MNATTKETVQLVQEIADRGACLTPAGMAARMIAHDAGNRSSSPRDHALREEGILLASLATILADSADSIETIELGRRERGDDRSTGNANALRQLAEQFSDASRQLLRPTS